MEKNLHPNHPLRCVLSGPSNRGKSVFLTKWCLKFFNGFDKIYNYSLSLHQDSYQNLNRRFSNYIPNNIIPTISNEEDYDIVIDDLKNIKDFEKSILGKETYNNTEELKYPQYYENNKGIIILDDLNEKKWMIVA